MPFYSFRCHSCDAARDAFTDLDTATALELVCVACGGTMVLAPVLTVNIIPSRSDRRTGRRPQGGGPGSASCTHGRHCRCAVRLTRPNPLMEESRRGFEAVEES